jgi:hypothetical protein
MPAGEVDIKIRVNGRAPAWPVLLGEQHPFYPIVSAGELGSASFSILAADKDFNDRICWEVLVDAGHNTVPFLLQQGNRIPEAIVLTHGHPDHILGIDWIVQSLIRRGNSSAGYPVYCTRGVWQMLINAYPHLVGVIRHIELLPGRNRLIEETGDLSVTAFPVFHGMGAMGASMLLFEQKKIGSHPILFTGDLLCPILRRKDFQTIERVKKLFIDTNNRFPDPGSNHISFARKIPGTKEDPFLLKNWFQNRKIKDLIQPHAVEPESKEYKWYFEEFLSDWKDIMEIPHTTIDFLAAHNIPFVYLVHYWGWYDSKNYGEALLDEPSLLKWVNSTARTSGLNNIEFCIPKVGEFIAL